MKAIRSLLCACSMSFGLVACDDIADPFIDDDDDDEVDELIVTTSVLDNWWTWSAFAMTDPLADPYFDGDGRFLTAPGEPPADAERAAQIVADSVDRYFGPAGCASVDRDGSTLTYTLDECSGPFVPVTVDGTLEASFSMDGDAIDFVVDSRELEIDGAPADLDVRGSYRASGDARTVEYSATPVLTGFGDGFSADFDGTVTWTAGSSCITSDGQGQVTAIGRLWNASLAGLARCADACPSAGVVTLSDDAETFSLTFDGRDRATLLRAGGEVLDVGLDCSPAR
jgi:hypothetical protein